MKPKPVPAHPPAPAPKLGLAAAVKACLAGSPPPELPPEAFTGPSPPVTVESQLPLWPELCRGVPNDVLRSALFAVSGPR
jgi:hypothetical protein